MVDSTIMQAGRYKAYPEYKDSGVEWLGQIPSGWGVLRGKYVFYELKERSTTGTETLLSVSEYFGVKPRSENISEGDHLTRAESLEGYKKCYKNDLVMNIMLAWKRGLGVSKFDGIVSPAYSVFRFKQNAYPIYMHNLFRTELYTGHFKTRSTGVIDSRLRLYPESFFDTEVILPTYQEQEKIANFLDYETAKIDTLIEKQQRLIELLTEKRQAVISHAVTKGLNPDVPMKDSGVEWLGEVPAHWRVCKLKHIKDNKPNSFVDGPFGSNLKSVHFVDNGDVFVIESNFATTGVINESKLKTITLNHFQTISRSEAQAGDIIIAKIGARYGMSSILPQLSKKCVVSGNSLKLTLNSKICNTEYINFLLQHLKQEDAMDDGVNVTAQPALSLGSLNNLPVILPPLDEQSRIILQLHQVLEKISNLSEHAVDAIQLMQERRTALISAAVTGKIDVRDWVKPE